MVTILIDKPVEWLNEHEKVHVSLFGTTVTPWGHKVYMLPRQWYSMARELGKLYVGVECANCGTHGEGVPTDDGRTRCGKCGQFGSEATGYCAEHDVDYGKIGGYDHCPMCREVERVNQMEQELMERRADPRMHPSVDAPRW